MRRLSNWLDSYMLYTEETEPPLLYRKWCGVSTVAACLQRKCRLTMGFNTWYPNFYIVLVGPSGRTRKGTAMGPAHMLLRQMDNIHMVADSITRAELIADMERSQGQDTDNTTQLPILHCSLTAICTELGVFMADWNEQFIMDLIKPSKYTNTYYKAIQNTQNFG